MSWPPAPDGFRRRADGRRALYAAESAEDELIRRGMDRGEGWETLLAAGDATTGRGASAVVGRWRIKKLRRGGWTARLWRDRYPSSSRLVAMLAASGEAARRGIPTPPAVALLLERDRGPLVTGYFATEEIDGAEDLARRALRGAATDSDLEEAMRTVRHMHDRGVDHPDLNLGNLLLVGSRIHVVDLDRVRFTDGPVPARRRLRAHRRLQRSCAKLMP